MQVARPQSLRRLLLTHELAFLILVVIMGGLASTWAYFWQQSSEETHSCLEDPPFASMVPSVERQEG